MLLELTVTRITILTEDGDSIYIPLSRYYTTPGQKQTIVMPFADFSLLANGTGRFDFVHLKDWTFVDPRPLNQPFVFSNMILLGGPPGCNANPTGPSAAPGTGAQPPAPEPAPQGSPTQPQTTQAKTSTQSAALNDANRFSAKVLNFWLVLLGFLA